MVKVLPELSQLVLLVGSQTTDEAVGWDRVAHCEAVRKSTETVAQRDQEGEKDDLVQPRNGRLDEPWQPSATYGYSTADLSPGRPELRRSRMTVERSDGPADAIVRLPKPSSNLGV